jgi:hypothetical protein
LYGESDTGRFLDAVRKLREQLRRKERQTRLAKQKLKDAARRTRADEPHLA